MSLSTSQKNLDITIKSDLGDDKLIVDELTVDETLHDFFDIKVIVHSEDIDINLESSLGKNMTITLNTHKNKRHFSGVVCRFEQIHTTVLEKQNKLIAFYQIQLRPKLWVLTHSRDYRIFQKKSVQEIIKEILSENSVTDYKYSTKKGTSKKREFCVQYDESHFEFIARLCEEEGIFFHFEHEASIHKLVFSDKDILATKIDGEDFPYAQKSPSSILLNHIYECIECEQITAKEFQTTDFDYLKPSTALSGKATGQKELGGKYFEYPGLFDNAGDGTNMAKTKLDALIWSKKFIQGSSTVSAFTPYKKFKLANHPKKTLNNEYIIYKVRHKISQNRIANQTQESGYERIYENQFWAYPSANTFSPIQKHFKKRIHSLQTATVTGPKGEEIHTDKYGRVKVKFHWDTRGKKDETSSCWIRVAQNWAGKQWGGLVIPRIDMEVIVSFIDGDPDRPLVMGCVYNGDALPPYAESNPTRSTFKTSSSKGNSGNNELRFEDQKDKEEIYIHAQKDMKSVIENNRTEEIVKGDDSLTIKKGKKTEKLEGASSKYETEITNGDRILKITKGNNTINLDSGDMKITLKNGKSETMLMNGNMKITLTNGALSIMVNGGGVSVISQQDIKFISQAKIMMQAAQGIMMNTPMNIMMQSGQNTSIQSGMNTNIQTGQNMNTQAGMNFMQQAGMNMIVNGGMNIIQKSGVNTISEAGVSMIQKATTILTNAEATQVHTAKGPIALKGAMVKLG